MMFILFILVVLVIYLVCEVSIIKDNLRNDQERQIRFSEYDAAQYVIDALNDTLQTYPMPVEVSSIVHKAISDLKKVDIDLLLKGLL